MSDQFNPVAPLWIPRNVPVFLVAGRTDLRKSVDGLADTVELQFGVTSMSGAIFLFCGKRHDRIKILWHEANGFYLVYSRAERGRYPWPRDAGELWEISYDQMLSLLSGTPLARESVIRILQSAV